MAERLFERMEALRREYAAAAPGKLAEIARLWLRAAAGCARPDELRRLHLAVHGMSGTGATLGFRALSRHARALESVVERLLAEKRAPNASEREEAERHLRGLEAALVDPTGEVDGAVEDDRASGGDAGEARVAVEATTASTTASPAAPGERQSTSVVLLENDAAQAEDLAVQLGHFGYRVTVAASLDELPAVCERVRPAALIADVPVPDENAGHCPARGTEERLPVVFLSERSDVPSRLQAVRAGAAAYFTKPVDVGNLVDTLDSLTSSTPPEPYRVLVVDDEPMAAEHAALVLESVGMVVGIVSDPISVDEAAAELHPDVVVMDMHMPGCSGLELAQVLRQQEVHVGMPILFLSADRDRDRQLLAIAHGGDDFLVKPVEDQHLIVQVASRARRARVLRSAMVRDSLTGLYNHTRTQELVGIELARAHRTGQPLAFAMLDLDLFKSINDRFGHPTGDRVIKNLARLLQQRLRKTDVVGRYGGEEFAVLFPNTTAAAAAAVLEGIREAFAGVRHQAAEGEFTATLSGGVAQQPGCPPGVSLQEAADRALYRAKAAGRNRVLLA